MEEKQQGYELPFAADPGVQIAFIVIGLLGVAGTVWFAWSEEEAFLLAFAAAFLVMVLYYAGQLLARLRITPDGIAITLFGITLRHVPAEEVRLIVALRKYNTKANPHDVMSVCRNSVEELTELGSKYMPKLLQSQTERWFGQTAAKYLYRRAESVRGELNLHNHILWLDWSAERLKLLLQMYPAALWMDGTEKKIFDTQIKQ